MTDAKGPITGWPDHVVNDSGVDVAHRWEFQPGTLPPYRCTACGLTQVDEGQPVELLHPCPVTLAGLCAPPWFITPSGVFWGGAYPVQKPHACGLFGVILALDVDNLIQPPWTKRSKHPDPARTSFLWTTDPLMSQERAYAAAEALVTWVGAGRP